MTKWTVVFILFSFTVFGQDVSVFPGTKQLIKVKDDFSLNYLLNHDQYVSSHWAKGKLFYANNSFKTYDSLNFNRFENIIELIVDNKPLSLFTMGLSGALIYTSDNSGYVLISVPVDGENKLLMVYSIGKYILAALTSVSDISYERMVKIDEIRFEPKPEKEVDVRNEYYVWQSNSWTPFKLSKSNIIKQFQADKKEISSVYASYSRKSSEEEALIKLFDYLN